MEIGLLFLIAFGIVGSVEARVRALLKRHERQLDAAREDLARIERKLDGLLRHGGASQVWPSGSGRWSLEHGDEIELYSLHKKGEGENGKRDWTATLKCKAVK